MICDNCFWSLDGICCLFDPYEFSDDSRNDFDTEEEICDFLKQFNIKVI
jgi:hypothetical protein